MSCHRGFWRTLSGDLNSLYSRLASASRFRMESFFSGVVLGASSSAAMQVSLSKIDGALSGEKIKGIAPLKAEDAPSITTERLREDYPLYATSLLNLVQNAEDNIKKNL